MSVFTRFTAFCLLALFMRVLVPDSVVLALHKHTHTVEKPIATDFAKSQVGTKHTHCQTDHLFNTTPYLLPVWVLFPVPKAFAPTYATTQATACKYTPPQTIGLRGPPQIASSRA